MATWTEGRRLAGLLMVAFVVPLVAHALELDLLLPAIFVIGLASLLRTGRTLVDRLIPAMAVSIGLATAAGLLFSIWPWGLSPVPVAWTGLGALVVVSAATRRRMRLPLRVSGSDLHVLGSGIAGSLVALAPSLGGDLTTRLAYAALTDDRMRHFNLFDVIQQVGGYTFLHLDQARPMVDNGMGEVYPSGMHFVYALLDSFVHPDEGTGAAFDEMLRYHWYVGAAYGAFVLMVVWSARWVAGPGLATWKAALLCSAVGTFLATGVMTVLIWYTADAEVLALAMLAVLVGFAARPPARVGKQVTMIAILVTAISFTYTLFLFFAAAACVAALAAYWRRLLRAWRITAVVAAVAVPIALVPVLLPRLYGFHVGGHFLGGDAIVAVPRRTLLAIGALILLAVLGVSATRMPRLRPLGAVVLLSAGGTLAVDFYIRYVLQSQSLYYFEKMVHALAIVLIIGAAPVVRGLRVGAIGRKPVLATAMASVVGIFLVGGVTIGTPQFDYSPIQTGGMRPGADTAWSSAWTGGQFFYASDAHALVMLRNAGLVQDGRPTFVIVDRHGVMNTHLSLVLASFNRNVVVVGKHVNRLVNANDLMDLPADPRAALPPQSEAGFKALTDILTSGTVPTRVVVSDAGLEARLRIFAADNPRLGLEILTLPRLPRLQPPALETSTLSRQHAVATAG